MTTAAPSTALATIQPIFTDSERLALAGSSRYRVSEATGADIEHLGLERGHRTLTITRKGGKAVTPHTLRNAFITAALDAGVPLRDVQEAASHADPIDLLPRGGAWVAAQH